MSWVIEGDDENAEKVLVGKFIDYLKLVDSRRKPFPEIVDALEKVDEMIEKAEMTMNKPRIQYLRKQRRHLELYHDMFIFGWNSMRYDMKILFQILIKVLEERKMITPTHCSNISILKKGTSYFSVKVNNWHFKDLMCFNCPMRLDKYLKTWTANEFKLVYPYTLFQTLDEIKNCKVFPAAEDFKTELKSSVDIVVYNKCKKLFEEKMALPVDDPKKWNSMIDYLRFYNESDVKPSSFALNIQFGALRQHFGVEPMICYGIPSYAQYAAYALYDRSAASLFSLSDPELVKMFRSQIYGGICNVYQRHVTLLDEEAPYAAKYNKSGQRWKTIEFFDLNSMYVSVFNKEFPTGRGFDWTLNNEVFTKKLMAPHGISMESLIWLDYMQNDKRFVVDGVVKPIRHGWNSNEVVLGKYPVDGCVVAGENTYILQYDGCYWHGCDSCGHQVRDAAVDAARDEYLSSIGVLIKIKSCEWRKQMFQKGFVLPPSNISPLFRRDQIQQREILQHIKADTVTGFILADIRPTEAAKKFERINWPPIFARRAIENDTLPSWMNKPRKPTPTLIQQMYGEKILLHTALVRFYLEHGFEVTHIHRFLEYQKDKCFIDFYDKLYNLRVDATIHNNTPQASAIKLVGNSTYGKFIQNPEKFTKTTVCGPAIYKQKARRPTFQGQVEISDTLYEIKEMVSKITEKYPLPAGNTILHLSKLLLANFMVFLEKFLVDDSWRILYSDTGQGLFLSLILS